MRERLGLFVLVCALLVAADVRLFQRVMGYVAHDAVDSGDPVKVGYKAIAVGANPTAVAENDRTDAYANRGGIPYTLGGHPNIISREVVVTDADGAQTGASIVSVATGTKIVVTMIAVACDRDNTANVSIRIAFDTDTTFAADSETGVDEFVFNHPDIAAGSGMVLGTGAGIIGIGDDDEDLRYSADDPVGGSCSIVVNYFTVPT